MRKTIKEISSIKSGKTPDTMKKQYYDGGTFLFFGTGEVKRQENTTKTKITQLAIQDYKLDLSKENTVYVGIAASTFGAHIPPIGSTSNQNVLQINLDLTLIRPKYFAYWFNDLIIQIEKFAIGSAYFSFNKSYIESIEIELPSLKIQDEIINII